MKIILIVGARPNFMKAAPILSELKKYPDTFDCLLIHTGQHYDAAMSKFFFDDLALPKPDIYLGIGSGTHAEQTGKIMIELEKIFRKENPDLIMVVGDVNSTMAGALTGAKLCIPIAHVEAGLRSFDRTMPEEINRIVTDSVSRYLFTSCMEGDENLIKEGHPKNNIYFVGNVMIDTLLKSNKISDSSNILDILGLKQNGLLQGYALVTLHRPSNVDDADTLQNIFGALHCVAQDMLIVFPVHPRTRKQIEGFGMVDWLHTLDDGDGVTRPVPGKINCVNPLGYLDFLKLMANAKIVLTDSGGIQEETTVLKVPCVTLRNNTERAITVREGTNVLAGNDKGKIIKATQSQIKKDFSKIISPKYWDGEASRRIVNILLETI